MTAPVLVVEDHDDSRELVESILRHAGYAVATAVHGRDALDQIERGLRPCLILLDVTMPVMDGPAFAEKLHASNDKELATTPIVLLTASFDTASAMTKTRALDVIRKPIALNAVTDRVQRHCRT